ncbi:NACHT domain-containing protein [Actinomycetospora straminea]|uniref:NACHT domain-containing protein n=1 Tax=Actinomycetospora straminea TaxID=663607 RepID=A0ABP9DYX3_9PSEU|nr:NACHT domain-containing protein [Actinomycetospora straminea]MDD7934176.1 NACHT domain-containing protein [Actinomycetospora straminea]
MPVGQEALESGGTLQIELGAAVSKVVGTAVGRIIGSVLGSSFSDFLFRREVKEQAAVEIEKEIDSELQDLTLAESRDLVAFIEGSEFEDYTRRLFSNSIIARKSDPHVDKYREELSERIRLLLPSQPRAATQKIALALYGDVSANVAASIVATEVATKVGRARLAQLLPKLDLALQRTEGHLNNLSRVLSLKPINDFEHALRPQVAFGHEKIRLPQLGSTRWVPLEQLYVRPRLHYGDGSLAPSIDSLERHHRLVILGDPGGGKTTLASYICLNGTARSSEAKVSSPTPVMVILRDHITSLEAANTSLSEVVLHSCSSKYNVGTDVESVEYLLLNGRLTVVFDGLDELVDVALRVRVAGAIDSFANRFYRARVIVTSRKIGYIAAPLDPSQFTRVDLDAFDDGAVRDYAQKWFTFDDTGASSSSADRAAAFNRDSAHVPDIRTNPLMLALMCSVYTVEGFIPQNRPELYEKCSTLLIERWDRDRRLLVRLPAESAVKPAIYAMAEWILGSADREKGVRRSELISFISHFLHPRRFEDYDEASAAATSFVDWFTGRAWVLTDVGSTKTEPLYGFTHRTFLEYFAAKKLLRDMRSGHDLFEALIPRIERAERDIISQMAFQMLFDDSESEGEVFAAKLLDAASTTVDSQRQAVLSFLARSLDFVVPSPAITRKVVARAFESFSTSHEVKGKVPSFPEQSPSHGPLYDLMAAADENLATISSEMQRQLENYMESRQWKASTMQLEVLALAAYPDGFARMRGNSTARSVSFWEGEVDAFRQTIDRVADLRSVAKYAEWISDYLLETGEMGFAEFLDARNVRRIFIANKAEWALTQPLATKILLAMARSRKVSHGKFRKSVPIDSDRILLVRALLAIRPPWAVVAPGERYFLSAQDRFVRAYPFSTAVDRTLQGLLAAFVTDYAFAVEPDIDAGRASRREYWHVLMGKENGELQSRTTADMLPAAADFFSRWLGGGWQTVIRQR